MAQRHRLDEIGARFHVTNRGIAKRTIAENEADAESFFEQLTLVVEAGIFAVEAAVLMTTHFHLLLLSLIGESWRGMRRCQNGHSRTFNRSRRRDGPLFRGRYLSRRVDSLAYRHNVIRYIDHNPVTARMVARPEDHPFGSARHYLHGTDAPWLAKNEVKRMVQGTTGAPHFAPDDYRAVFGYGPSSPELIEQRLLRPDTADDALSRLLPASPSRTLDWMTWKAQLADGTTPGEMICLPATVDALIAGAQARDPQLRVQLNRDSVPAWPIMQIGLLRGACGQRLTTIGARVGRSVATVHGRVRQHVELVRSDAIYAQVAASVLSEALAVDWGMGRRQVKSEGARAGRLKEDAR